MNYDHQKKEELENSQQEARQKEAGEREQARKKLAAANKIIRSTSLFSQRKSSDVFFYIALVAASLNDLLSLFQVTGAGYALVVIMTILIFIFIGFMVMLGVLAGGGGGISILLMLLGGTITEILPGISLLPATTGIVVAMYIVVLKKRKKNAEKIEQQRYAEQESYA
ncbi:MAG: hypothetical protein WA055_00875 [Candidatus Moraniibacteriota bacterium]